MAAQRWVCIIDDNGIELFRRSTPHTNPTIPDSTQMALLSVIHNQFSMRSTTLQSVSARAADDGIGFTFHHHNDITIIMGGHGNDGLNLSRLLTRWMRYLGITESVRDTDLIRRRLRWLSGAIDHLLQHDKLDSNIFLASAYNRNHSGTNVSNSRNKTYDDAVPIDITRRVNHSADGCSCVVSAHSGVIQMSETWHKTIPQKDHCSLLSLAVALSADRSIVDIPISLRNDSMVRLVCLSLGDDSTVLVRLVGQDPRDAMSLIDSLPNDLVSSDMIVAQKLKEWTEGGALLALSVSSAQGWHTRWTVSEEAGRTLNWFVEQEVDYSRARLANGWRCIGGNMSFSVSKKTSIDLACWCVFEGSGSLDHDALVREIGESIVSHILAHGTAPTASKKSPSGPPQFPFIVSSATAM